MSRAHRRTNARRTTEPPTTWLKVTANGQTGGRLSLRADPTGLAPDTAYDATVTVKTAPDAAFQDTQRIHVGLWVGSADPVTVSLPHGGLQAAANPVAPLAYVAIGGTSIDVFNVYSGQRVSTFAHVAPSVGRLVPSSDGLTLYAADLTNYRILALDARTGQQLGAFPLYGAIPSNFSFALGRPGGRATLFAPGFRAIDVATGRFVSGTIASPTFGTWYSPFITSSADGSRLAVIERGLSPGSIYGFTVTAGAAGGWVIANAKDNTFINGENCQAMAMSLDGTRLYPACGWPYEFDVYAWASMKQVQTLPADHYPNNAAMDADGNFVGGLDGLYDASDVYVFNAKGYLLGTVPTTNQTAANGQQSDFMAVSGDGTRVMTATPSIFGTDQQLLVFRSTR